MLSKQLWKRAMSSKQASSSSTLIPSSSLPELKVVVEKAERMPVEKVAGPELWVGQALDVDFREVCELLAEKSRTYNLLSGQMPRNACQGLPLMRIVEIRSELELIQIWSRIFVSTMRKTSAIERPESRLGRAFRLDAIHDLPTRLEEAGDPYALQVSTARAVVDRSIEAICQLELKDSPVHTLAQLTKGVWSLAFAKPEIAREVAIEIEEKDEEHRELGCVEAYLQLVLGRPSRSEPRESFERLSTLDKLASLTIRWLSLRRQHLILNVLPHQSWWNPPNTDLDPPSHPQDHEDHQEEMEAQVELLERCQALKVFMEQGPRLERNPELIDRSTKQTAEAIEAGEDPEYDLELGLRDCMRALEVIQSIGKERLEGLRRMRRLK